MVQLVHVFLPGYQVTACRVLMGVMILVVIPIRSSIVLTSLFLLNAIRIYKFQTNVLQPLEMVTKNKVMNGWSFVNTVRDCREVITLPAIRTACLTFDKKLRSVG